MKNLPTLQVLFVIWVYFFQTVLIAHFALRKWARPTALKYGWLVYALGAAGAVVSFFLLLGGETRELWIGGFIHFIWSCFGFIVEYVQKKEWRSPIDWPIFGPYLSLYLATMMFYWWPLGLLSRGLWFGYALLFVLSTVLNITSHESPNPPVAKT